LTRALYSHPTGWWGKGLGLELPTLLPQPPPPLPAAKPPPFNPGPCIVIVWPPPPPLPPPQSPIRAAAGQPPVPELQFTERPQRHQSHAKAHPPDVPKPLCSTKAEILPDVAGGFHPRGSALHPPPPLPPRVGADGPHCLAVAKARPCQLGMTTAMGTATGMKTKMTTTMTMGVLVMVGRCNGDQNLGFNSFVY
jgi:hypothetical protein